MNETHNRSSISASAPQRLSASGHALRQLICGFISLVFIHSVRHNRVVPIYISIHYNFHHQAGFFCHRNVCALLNKLKFEIISIVFRLYRGNLPVRINEQAGSLLPQRLT
jgi:hypothetical protein